MQALLIVVFVGGLSLLAQWGRKNRTVKIVLIFVLLFASFLLTALGTLVALAGWPSVIPASGLPPEFSVSSGVVIVLAGLAGLALCVTPLRKAIGGPRTRASYHDATNPGREALAATRRSSEGRWSDPPIFFALWMFVVVLASNVVVLLAFALMPNVVGSVLSSAGRLSPFTIFVGQLPLAVIALCGVGLGVRRNLRETIARLGYGPVSPLQLGVVALFIAGAILLSAAADALFATLQPDLYRQVGEISDNLFNPKGLSPVWAVLFASMHVQYGPSLLLVYLLVVSFGLGLLRKHINTTASFLAHAGYNTLGVLLTYFFGS